MPHNRLDKASLLLIRHIRMAVMNPHAVFAMQSLDHPHVILIAYNKDDSFSIREVCTTNATMTPFVKISVNRLIDHMNKYDHKYNSEGTYNACITWIRSVYPLGAHYPRICSN